MTMAATAVEQEVQAKVDEWLGCIENLDFERMPKVWDMDFVGLVYQPEEYEEPWTTGEELLKYWANVPTIIENVPAWHATRHEITVIGDVAVVFSILETSIKIKEVPKKFEGPVRLSMALRRTDDGWKLIHYHESRLVSVESILAELTA